MEADLKSVIYSTETIQARVADLAAKISEDYRDKNPVMICLLKGAVVFYADLIRNMDLYLELDFMAVSSYGSASTSSGVVSIRKELDKSIEGRHVILVEDIIDTGLTLLEVCKILKARKPASLIVCCLLDKSSQRKHAIVPEYIGFSLTGNPFLVGYGLDYSGKYRNLPYVAELKPEVYELPS
jgi:hypoxanthine phosphoribosyltransferase